MTDERELVQECLSGSSSAHREFVRRFQVSVYGLCVRMLSHRQDAEDVAQESFARAFRHLHHWDAARPLKPWILTIAANQCRTFLSQRQRRDRPVESVDDLARESNFDQRIELAEELQLAITRLRDEQRLCFILYYLNELSLAEVAEITGNPAGTVKTWLRRARLELADYLQRRSIVPMLNQGES